MNFRIILLCMMLANALASASLYRYPQGIRPSVSLKDASGIAETIIAKVGVKGYYALDASLLGDEKQSGAGAWTFHYRNTHGKEILISVCFPEDMCIYQGPAEDGKYVEMGYTRGGEVSKQWLEQQAKAQKEDPFVTPPAEQAGPGQPAPRPESKSEGGDKPQPESEGRSR